MSKQQRYIDNEDYIDNENLNQEYVIKYGKERQVSPKTNRYQNIGHSKWSKYHNMNRHRIYANKNDKYEQDLQQINIFLKKKIESMQQMIHSMQQKHCKEITTLKQSFNEMEQEYIRNQQKLESKALKLTTNLKKLMFIDIILLYLFSSNINIE